MSSPRRPTAVEVARFPSVERDGTRHREGSRPSDRRDLGDRLHADRRGRRIRTCWAARPCRTCRAARSTADGSFLAPARTRLRDLERDLPPADRVAVWQALPSQRSGRPPARGRLVDRRHGGAERSVARRSPSSRRCSLTVVGIVAAAHRAVRDVPCRRCRLPAEGFVDSVLIDGATGLHLGWVGARDGREHRGVADGRSVRRGGRRPPTSGASRCSSLVGVIGVTLASASGWRVTPGLAMAMGPRVDRGRAAARRAAERADRGHGDRGGRGRDRGAACIGHPRAAAAIVDAQRRGVSLRRPARTPARTPAAGAPAR